MGRGSGRQRPDRQRLFSFPTLGSGFSLLEVILGVLLASLGVVAIVTFTRQSAHQQAYQELVGTLELRLRSRLDILAALPFRTLDRAARSPGQVAPVLPVGLVPPLGVGLDQLVRSERSRVVSLEEGLLLVKVECRWNLPGERPDAGHLLEVSRIVSDSELSLGSAHVFSPR